MHWRDEMLNLTNGHGGLSSKKKQKKIQKEKK
jgi:hypothetical protein